MSAIASPTNFLWSHSASNTPTILDTVRDFRDRVLDGITCGAVNELQIYSTTHKISQLTKWGASWDGVEVIPVSLATIAHATGVVEQIFCASRSLRTFSFIEPNVTASADGEVVLEWWNGRKKLTTYISEAHTEYVKVWGPDIDEEMEEGSLSDENAINLLLWLEE